MQVQCFGDTVSYQQHLSFLVIAMVLIIPLAAFGNQLGVNGINIAKHSEKDHVLVRRAEMYLFPSVARISLRWFDDLAAFRALHRISS